MIFFPPSTSPPPSVSVVSNAVSTPFFNPSLSLSFPSQSLLLISSPLSSIFSFNSLPLSTPFCKILAVSPTTFPGKSITFLLISLVLETAVSVKFSA